MRVAIVHDDLVQFGGAERVLEGICEIYPDAPIFTSVFDRENKELNKRFGKKKIVTSFLQKIPGWKFLYKPLLPLYPIAFEQFVFDEYDLVISHTTRFAKSIITKPQTKHICYCHTPPRFLWNFSKDRSYRALEIILSKMRVYDQITSKRVDFFIAGSENAKLRIKKVYDRDSKVVYPFIDLARFGPASFDGGYFLVITRLNKYKRVDLVVKACSELNLPLKIVGTGPEFNNLVSMSSAHTEFLGNVSDEMIVFLLLGARALVIPGVEDFGLTALEAQAAGKPVIAFREGGALETVTEKTGLFFDAQTVDNLKGVLLKFDPTRFNLKISQENASQYNRDKFIRNFKQAVSNAGA